MSEEKKKKTKRISKAKIPISQMQTCQLKCISKLLSQRYFLFVLLLIFKRQDGVLIIIKVLSVWPHFRHNKAFLLLLKHHLFFWKLITRFIIIKINYQIHYQIHYQSHYQIHQINLDLNHH